MCITILTSHHQRITELKAHSQLRPHLNLGHFTVRNPNLSIISNQGHDHSVQVEEEHQKMETNLNKRLPLVLG